MWKEISNNQDAICFEKRKKGFFVRLEARHEEGKWNVYKGYYRSDELNYTEEFSAASRDEAERMMFQLKREKEITLSELTKLVKDSRRKVNLSFRRSYKDDVVEKWMFRVNNDETQNFFVMREFEKIEMDIVIHEKYKARSDEIVQSLADMFSIDDSFGLIQHIYYFSGEKIHSSPGKEEGIFESFEMGFGKK